MATSIYRDYPPSKGNEEALKAERGRRWSRLFPILRNARQELALAEAEKAAAQEELREAEAAVEDHEYSKLLAARDAARERAKEAKARSRRELESTRQVAEDVPSPSSVHRREFDRQYEEWLQASR